MELTAPYNRRHGVVTGIIIFLAIMAFIVAWSKPLLQQAFPDITEEHAFFTGRLAQWAVLLALMAYVKNVEKQPFLLWKESRMPVLVAVVWVFFLLFIVMTGGLLISFICRISGFNAHNEVLSSMLTMSFSLRLLTVLTAAVVEELIFRGYLMPRLQLYISNERTLVLVSALIFGLMHFRYGTVANIVIPFYIGLVFARNYLRHSNLKVLIVTHFIIDAIALLR